MKDAKIQPERRSFFRIDHDVVFDYRQTDAYTADHGEPEEALGDDKSVNLLIELRKIDRGAQESLKILADKNRLLADYLQRMNSKIDLVARHALFASPSSGEAKRINLSEGGITFPCNRVLYQGNYLVLRVIFLPSYTPVVIFAQVTRCEGDDEDYQIAAQFHRLRDQDRQELARHILKAQVGNQRRRTTTENPQR